MDQENINPAQESNESEIVVEPMSEKSKNDSTKNAHKDILSYLHDLVFGLVAILLLFMFLFRVVVVSGPSMMQTLQNGDRLILLSNVLYTNPKYGDIVVVSKNTFKNGEPIIKRVIATQGQTVDIDFNAGIVYVDGVALEENYTYTPTNVEEGIVFPITIAEGCIFAMGDNRNGSRDSRDPQIGMIDQREILGKALFLIFPGTGEKRYEATRDFSRIGVLN